ncbi:MAG: hypothetical protein K9K64_02285 [Desulfohalobiaceae bacterium]|nr:hypothetical protein [Desulfohalobiaceae bacterium]
MTKVNIISESCKGVESCGICIYVCPKGLFGPSSDMNSFGYIPPKIQNIDECTGCQNCMIYCPDFAIVVQGRYREEETAEEDEYE